MVRLISSSLILIAIYLRFDSFEATQYCGKRIIGGFGVEIEGTGHAFSVERRFFAGGINQVAFGQNKK